MSAAEFSEAKAAVNAPVAANPLNESLTVLEAADTKISILSKGARVASWHVRERGHWIELVVPEKKRMVLPLETFPDVNFAARKISDTAAVFSATLPNGLVMTKELALLTEPPFHSLKITVSNPTRLEAVVDATLPLGNGVDKHEVGLAYDPKLTDASIAEMRALGLSERVKSWKPGLIFGRTVDVNDPDKFKWVAVDNNHFMLAAIAPADKPFTHIKAVADRTHPPLIALPLSAALKPGESVSYEHLIYAGPKEYNNLRSFGHELEKAVDFGFFGVIAKILLRALIFFDSLTGNYGWAIILLTFCIQVLVFPLTRKNLQHSAKMRELQPQIKKLQEQYKSDPKRLQVETFNFYKRNGMQFMGLEGCIPMLLQLPLFFAFYSTLHVAYELRGAPWIFWIKDLALHDPYYVLPIVMGIGMFLQQKLTAVAADPAQARMMMFMPLIFVFMFLKLPAGLVLYWCMNSLVTIVIQLILGANKKTDLQPAT